MLYTYFVSYSFILNGSPGQHHFGNNILTYGIPLNLSRDMHMIKKTIESTEIGEITPQNVVILNFIQVETLQKDIE
jgi:hypothetical protein